MIQPELFVRLRAAQLRSVKEQELLFTALEQMQQKLTVLVYLYQEQQQN